MATKSVIAQKSPVWPEKTCDGALAALIVYFKTVEPKRGKAHMKAGQFVLLNISNVLSFDQYLYTSDLHLNSTDPCSKVTSLLLKPKFRKLM